MDINILEKKNCLITGATGGLGKQIAIELAKKNCNLFLTSMEENLGELKQELEKLNNKILIKYQHADLRKLENVNNLMSLPSLASLLSFLSVLYEKPKIPHICPVPKTFLRYNLSLFLKNSYFEWSIETLR